MGYNKKTIQEKINNKFPKDNLEVLEFTKVKEKTVIKCLKCGEVYERTSMDHVINSKRTTFCTKCFPLQRKDTLDIKHKVEYLIQHSPNLEVITNFNKITDDLEFKCLKCNNNFKRKPQIFLKSNKCPFCETYSKKKPNNVFLEDIKKRDDWNEYEFLEEYKDSYSKIKVRHSCGFIYYTTPHNFLNGKGCPKCNRFQSKGEKRIKRILERLGINFETQKRFSDLNNLSFDFYLPEYNLLIEYQGGQHFQPIKYFGGQEKFNRQQENDSRKRLYCKKNNYNLLEIDYINYNNIENIISNWLNDYPKGVVSSENETKTSLNG